MSNNNQFIVEIDQDGKVSNINNSQESSSGLLSFVESYAEKIFKSTMDKGISMIDKSLGRIKMLIDFPATYNAYLEAEIEKNGGIADDGLRDELIAVSQYGGQLASTFVGGTYSAAQGFIYSGGNPVVAGGSAIVGGVISADLYDNLADANGNTASDRVANTVRNIYNYFNTENGLADDQLIVQNGDSQYTSNYDDAKLLLKQSLEEELQQSLTDQAFEELLLGTKYSDTLKYSEALKNITNKNPSGITNINIDIKQDAKYHLIESGDTLSSIAAQYGVSVELLQDLNRIDNPDLIIEGNTLKLKEPIDKTTITVNDEIYEVKNGDKSILLTNSGIIATNAVYLDSEGNPVSIENAFFTTTDSEGNTITVLKEGIKSQAQDGDMYEVQSLVNQVENGIRGISKFAFDQTTKFAQGYQQYLADHIDDILSDFAMRIARGESMEDAMKDVAEFWGVKALVENSVIDSAVGDLIGNFTENQQLIGGAKAGVAHFLATILIAETRGDGLDSKQYTEEAVKAAAIAYAETLQLPVPAGVVIAITDAAITAVDDGPDFNSEGWQDYATSTVAAVSTAYLAWQMGAVGMKIGASIGTAILPGVGTAIGAFVGAVVGALIGGTLYMPLKNWGEATFEASEELYDAIEDTIIKMDLSYDNMEENAKQAIKAVEDIAKAYFIDLPADIFVGVMNLFTGGDFYSGQTYGVGEAGSPVELLNQLYQVRHKADGTGLEIIGVGREGVTLKASQNGIDDIYGSAHSDVMVGNDQNNVIIGSTASDNGADNDMIEGKGGDDILLGKEGHDHIDGGDGNDQIDGGVGNDRLIGGAGDDVVIGDEGDDIIEGNDGNDQIDAGAGDDIVDAGAGDDVIVTGTGHDQVNAGEGHDVIYTENGDDLIKAGAGDDNIDSGDGNDEIYGQDGNDNINSGLGDDVIFAGAGVDTVNAGLGNDIVDAGSDDDLVLAGLGNDIIYGNLGNDDLYGEIGNDYIMGGTGDDEIGGGEGDDILEGNAGNDTLDGGVGDDLFIHNLGDGNTEISDESGSDIIRVFGVADQNNISFTQNGNDLEITFSENAGDKITIKDQFLDSNVRIESLRIDNNTEIDLTSLAFDASQNASYNTSTYSDAIDQSELTAKYQNILKDSNNEVIYNADSSWYTNNYDTNVLTQEIDYTQYNEVQIRSYKAKRNAFGGHYTIYYKYYESNLGGTFGNDKIVGSWWNENIFGGAGNDYLYGNDGNDTIFGGDDHDLIYLGSGNDSAYGENGFDKIYGGEGNDTIEGNADNDTLYGEHGNDVIMGRSGDDLAFGGKGNDFLKGGTGHDILFGGDNSDNIEGEDGNDYLLGEKGDDIISGGNGDDTIIGGDGNDIINGDAGNDTIKGGTGHDIIDGGAGNDIIEAGSGNDMIIDSAGSDTLTLGDGKDILMVNTEVGGTRTITDFNKDEDRVVLKNVTTTFNNLVAANHFVQEGANVRFTYNNYNLVLENTQLSDIDSNNFVTSIIGDELDNILNGDEYANAIFGLDGNDILNGNGGNDLLWGGAGSDQLNGGAGDDILYYNIDSYWQGSRQVVGKWDVINRTPSTVSANNGEVADLTDNTASQDLFDGGDGDDVLIMSEQDDTILLDSALNQVEQWNNTHFEENNQNGFGGLPIDIETIYAFGGDDVINLSSNTNTYGDVRIYGDDGNDTIWTNQGNDVLFGGDGNDNIQGGKGNDEIYGGNGNDILKGGNSENFDLFKSDGLRLGFWGDENNSEQLVGDFNGDGIDDIVNVQAGAVANNWVSISNGDGTFNSYTNIAGLGPTGFWGNENNSEQLIGDFNGDGKDDVVNLQSNGSNWLAISNGDGTFNNVSTGLYGFWPDENNSTQLIGDFNGDGKDDIVNLQSDGTSNNWIAIAGENNQFSLMRYNLGIERGYWGNKNNSEQLIGDFNGDGLDDIANVQSDGNNWFAISKGDGTFYYLDNTLGTNGYWPDDNNSTQLIGDFNGDGKDDIANLQSDGVSNNFVSLSNLNTDIDDDVIYGGEGDDDIRGYKGDDKLYGEDNNDTIYGGEGNDELRGGNDNDTLHGESDNDKLYGGSGEDYLDGGIGDDELNGDEDNDKLYGFDGNDTLNGGSGNDELRGQNGNDIINGDEGNDNIYGGLGDDIVDGGDGDDMINYTFASGAVNVNLSTGITSGADGNDELVNIENIHGSAHNDYLSGDEKDNIVHAHTGNDTIHGDGGNDTLYGNAGNDTLYGGSGNDTLFGNEGDDYLDGEDGDDIVNYTFASGIVNVNLLNHLATGASGNDRIYNVENIHGSAYNDNLTGDNANNYIYGHIGNDYIYGQAGYDSLYGNVGNDFIYGQDGNDTLFGNEGDDYLDGGSGSDMVNYTDASSGVNVNLLSNSASGGGGNDRIYNIENIHGSAHNDTLTGNNSDNVIHAHVGDDNIYGNRGNDSLFGNAGNDNIYGGMGDDLIRGGEGNDFLSGDDNISIHIGGANRVVNHGGPLSAHQWLIGDFDGDGKDDVVVGNTNEDYFVSLSANNFAIQHWLGVPWKDAAWNNVQMKVGDFNGDGKDDLALANDYNDYHVWTSDGTKFNHIGSFVNHGGSLSAHQWRIADLNGDGLDDIVVANRANDYYVSISNGNGFNGAQRWLDHGGDVFNHQWQIGDFNGDGNDDIVVANELNDYYVSMSNSQGTGFSSMQLINHGGSLSAHQWQIGDFNGDGLDDVIVGSTNEDYYVSLSNGNGFNTSHWLGVPWKDAAWNNVQMKVGDFNGDGKDDLALANDYNDYHVWTSDGTKFNHIGSFVNHGGSLSAHQWQIGNFNGDGNSDIMVANELNDYYLSTTSKDSTSDTIYGGSGNDSIYGGLDNDLLYGDEGDDTLNGGSGADILNGGSGSDSFDFSSLEDSSINAMDEIEDFEQGSDKINLSEIEEDLSFDSFEFVVENGHTIVKDKNSDFAVGMQGEFNLNEDDFIF